MLCTEIVSDIRNNFCAQHVLSIRASDKDLPVKAVSWGSITKVLSSESLVSIKEFKGCKRERWVQEDNRVVELHTIATQLWSFKLL